MKKLLKKLIVTVNLKNLPFGKFMTKSKAMVKAQEDNPGMVTGLDPAATVVKAKLVLIDNKNTERKNLEQTKKELTGEINTLRNDVTNILTDSWAGEVQKASNGDVDFVKLFGFGVKGIDDGHSEPEVTIANSIPLISEVLNTRHLHQDVSIINSSTKSIALPKGAKECVIFLLIGTTEPSDISQMQYQGATQKGKFSHDFKSDEAGKTAYYIAVYTSKATGKPVATASVLAKLLIS
ncbi:MAG: hypothetical protein WCH34_15675 [Bacteroidota bacterium]